MLLLVLAGACHAGIWSALTPQQKTALVNYVQARMQEGVTRPNAIRNLLRHRDQIGTTDPVYDTRDREDWDKLKRSQAREFITTVGISKTDTPAQMKTAIEGFLQSASTAQVKWFEFYFPIFFTVYNEYRSGAWVDEDDNTYQHLVTPAKPIWGDYAAQAILSISSELAARIDGRDVERAQRILAAQ